MTILDRLDVRAALALHRAAAEALAPTTARRWLHRVRLWRHSLAFAACALASRAFGGRW